LSASGLQSAKNNPIVRPIPQAFGLLYQTTMPIHSDSFGVMGRSLLELKNTLVLPRSSLVVTDNKDYLFLYQEHEILNLLRKLHVTANFFQHEN
jgi:hypothetical protein